MYVSLKYNSLCLLLSPLLSPLSLIIRLAEILCVSFEKNQNAVYSRPCAYHSSYMLYNQEYIIKESVLLPYTASKMKQVSREAIL